MILPRFFTSGILLVVAGIIGAPCGPTASFAAADRRETMSSYPLSGSIPVVNSNNLTFEAVFSINSETVVLNLDTGSSLLWVPTTNALCIEASTGKSGSCSKTYGKKEIPPSNGTSDVILAANYGVGNVYGNLSEKMTLGIGGVDIDMVVGLGKQVLQPAGYFSSNEDGLLGLGLPYNIWTCDTSLCPSMEGSDRSCQICGPFSAPFYANKPVGPLNSTSGGRATQKSANLVQQIIERYGEVQMNVYIPMFDEGVLTFGEQDPSKYDGDMEWVDVVWNPDESAPLGLPAYWQFALGDGPWERGAICALDSGASIIVVRPDLFQSWLAPLLAAVPGILTLNIPSLPTLYTVPLDSIDSLPTLSFPIGDQIFNLTGEQYSLTDPTNIEALFFGFNFTLPVGRAVVRVASAALPDSTAIIMGNPFMQWHYSSFKANNDSWVTGAQVGLAKIKQMNQPSTTRPSAQSMPSSAPSAGPFTAVVTSDSPGFEHGRTYLLRVASILFGVLFAF